MEIKLDPNLFSSRNFGVVIGVVIILFGIAHGIRKINKYRSTSSTTGGSLVDRFGNAILQIFVTLMMIILGLIIIGYTGFFVQ